MQINKGFIIKRIFLYIWVISFIVFFIFPIYWILMTSLQERESLFAENLSFIPKSITFSNYIELFTSNQLNVVNALGNSLKVAFCATLVCLILGILGSYAFARMKFKGSKILFYFLIFTQMLPPISFLLPFYIFYIKLGLLNKWYGLVIGYIAWLLPIVTWVLYGYFKSIPRDLEEAARIDGCSRVGALFRIIIPVSLPGIIASGIISFMFSMGEFLFALTITTDSKVHTLPVEITVFLSKFSLEYGKMTATAMLTMIVPVILVLIFQRYLVEGLTKGAVKE